MARAAGDIERATARLEEALTLYREVNMASGQVWSLRVLGVVAAERGDPSQSAARYGQALALARDLGNQREVAFCLAGLANVARSRGDAGRAVGLFAVAQVTRDEIGIAPDPIAHADHERALAALRAELGEATFAAAWEAGRALTRDVAIEEALALAGSAAASVPSAATERVGPATPRLSPRERDVLRLVAAGRSDREIAAALSIGTRTVEWHVANVLGKLGLDSRSAAAAYAVRHGLG